MEIALATMYASLILMPLGPSLSPPLPLQFRQSLWRLDPLQSIAWKLPKNSKKKNKTNPLKFNEKILKGVSSSSTAL